MLDFDLLGSTVQTALADPLKTINSAELIVFPAADFEASQRGRNRRAVIFTVQQMAWSQPVAPAALSAIGQNQQSASLKLNFFISSFSLRGPEGVFGMADTIFNKLNGVQLLPNTGRAVPEGFALNTRDEVWQWLYDFSWSISFLEAKPGLNALPTDGLPVTMFP